MASEKQLAYWRAAMEKRMVDWCAVFRPGAQSPDGAGGTNNAAAAYNYLKCRLVEEILNVTTRELEGERLQEAVIAQSKMWTAFLPYGSDVKHSDQLIGLKNVWQPLTAYKLGDSVLASPPNGRVHICRTAGTSGAAAPLWEPTAGSQTIDGAAVWETMLWLAGRTVAEGDYVTPLTPTGAIYKCVYHGVCGGSQPTWPTATGVIVADGGAQWTVATQDWWTHVIDVLAVVKERSESMQMIAVGVDRTF